MNINRYHIAAALMLAATSAAARMPEASDISVRDINVSRNGGALDLAFVIDASRMPSGVNNETCITPMLVTPTDTLRMESVTLAGRNRIVQARRTGVYDNPANTYYRLGKTPEIAYAASVTWMPWMDHATLQLDMENVGCCNSVKDLGDLGLARLNMGRRTFDVDMSYITPVEERVKMRNAKGEAYIDFMVNKTNILPDYRNNPVELAKIQATIDSIKSDSDTKITTLSITGYASPEGSYSNNERLAKGRTEALADYVRNLYTFPADLMKTSWVAEDWAGLRTRVAESTIENKDAILALIDSDLAPDAKDQKIKKEFPTQYAFMLQEWYPALRHSDYEVAYEVRKYTDPAEIARVLKTNPSKLSLRELFILAETLKPDSKDYREVFDTAATLYPDSEVANLNAANCAVKAGELAQAERYLAKAGNTPQAAYARGVLAAKQGKYAEARKYFQTARAGGLNIDAALRQLDTAEAPAVEFL